MDENVPLTNADLLARLQELENRQESNKKEMVQMEERIQKATAAKYRRLQEQAIDNEQSNKNGDETDSDDEKESLPESTASFFVVAKYPLLDTSQGDNDIDPGNDDPETETGPRSPTSSPKSPWCCKSLDWTSRDVLFIPFWFAVVALILQLSIYYIVLANSADFRSEKDPFRIPIGVDPWTRAAEFLAIFITVYSQEDFFDGLNLFGYSAQLVNSTETKVLSLRKCYLAAGTQVVVGFLGMLLTFLLIVQSTEVIDLLLNFTAMEFVANLDQIAFMLARSGYLFSAGEETAALVASTRFEKTEKPWWLKRWPHFTMLVVLYSLWGWVTYSQMHRKYGDNEIYIQFTDDVVPWLGTLSGTYVGTCFSGKNANLGVVIYENEDQKRYCKDHTTVDCRRGIFFYCQDDVKEWRFDIVESNADLDCEKWVLKGIHDDPELSGMYDILLYSSAKWFARDLGETIALRDEITMLKEFDANTYKEQEVDVLESSGMQFIYPYYHQVVMDEKIHDRPVYAAFDGNRGEFTAFNGYRWILVKYDNYECSSCGDDVDENCFNECVKAFDPFYSTYTADLVSDPMPLQTSGDTWVPSNELVWFTAKGIASETQPDVEDEGLPVLLSAVFDMTTNSLGLKDPSARDIANKIFAQTSRLSRSTTFQKCADGETSFLVEVKTDFYPQETNMIVMELNEANPLFSLVTDLTSSLRSVLAEPFDFSSFVYNTFQRQGELHESTTFSWDPLTPRVFGLGEKPGRVTTYRYGTCLPRNSCVAVLLFDAAFRDDNYTYGDGIEFPGRFDLYLDSKKVFDNNENPTNFFSCIYQLGPSCDYTRTVMRCES